MEEILEVVRKQGIKLEPIGDNKTELVLTVEGDLNDGDYITETFDFSFDEIAKAIKIERLINELPEDFESEEELLWEEDDEFGFELGEYIPSGEMGFVDEICSAELSIIICGVSYKVVE